jgi:hypothetical protein
MNACMQVCMCACMRARVCVFVCICVYVPACVCGCVRGDAYAYMYSFPFQYVARFQHAVLIHKCHTGQNLCVYVNALVRTCARVAETRCYMYRRIFFGIRIHVFASNINIIAHIRTCMNKYIRTDHRYIRTYIHTYIHTLQLCTPTYEHAHAAADAT